MKNKITISILLCALLIFFTGCSVKDAVEINKREYIFAVGIDTSKDKAEKYTFTAEVPIISSGSEDKRFILSQDAQSLTSFYYDNVLSTDEIASDSLMQVIIIGEEAIKDENSIKRLFDEIERSPQINRKVKIVVAKEKASDIINFEIADNPLIGRYISEFLIKLKKLSFQTTYSFDEVVLNLQNTGNALIPAVEINNDRICIDGAAVVKNYRLIDYIDHTDNGLISMLTRGASTGLSDIIVSVDNTPVSLTYENVTVSQDINLVEDKLTAKYYVTVYLNINSYDLTKHNSSDSEFIQNICDKVNANMTNQTNKLLEKMQKAYQMDILNIQEDLIKFNKSSYDRVKYNYEEVFTNADINILYNIKINNSGMVK